MNKEIKLIISIVMLVAAIVIYSFNDKLSKNIDDELLSFLLGFLLVAGIFIPISLLVKKNKA